MNTEREKTLFETMPLPKAMFQLAFPAVLGQIIIVIYNVADTFFIGLTGDDSKLTAVTICMPAFMFLSAISNLFGIGGCSTISRALGNNNKDRAGNIAAFSLWGCILTALGYILFVSCFINSFIDWLGGNKIQIHTYAYQYLVVTVIFGGVFTAISNVLSHLIRSEGNGFASGFGMMLGGILNIVFDPLFMFVLLKPGNEILGAALATALSNLISMLFFILIIFKNRFHSSLSFSPKKIMLTEGIAADVFAVGLPACVMTLCENLSYAVLDHLLAEYGVTVQAGIGVAKKVNMMAHSIVRGMAQGMLPLISYNYAWENHDRMKNASILTIKVSVLCASVCTLTSLVLSKQLVGIFIQSTSQSLTYGANFLIILCLGGPFSACAYSCISFFQATGMGKKAFLLAVMRKGMIDIPLMFLLDRLLPIYGAVVATPATDILCCAVSIVLLYKTMQTTEKCHSAEICHCNF